MEKQEHLTDSDKEEWRNLLQKIYDHASKPETTHEDWWPHTEQDVKEFLEDLVEEMGKPEDVIAATANEVGADMVILGISPRTLRYKLARLREQGVELPAGC